MSQPNDELSETQILMEQFINSWARYSIDHPQVTLGDWLKTFSIMTGLAMKMASMDNDSVPRALVQMNNVATSVFKRADDHVVVGTIQ